MTARLSLTFDADCATLSAVLFHMGELPKTMFAGQGKCHALIQKIKLAGDPYEQHT